MKHILNCRPDQQAIVLYPHKTRHSTSWRRYQMQGFLCGYVVEKLFGIKAGKNPIKLEIRTSPKKGFKAIYPHTAGSGPYIIPEKWADNFDADGETIAAYKHFINYINRYFPRKIDDNSGSCKHGKLMVSYRVRLFIRATVINGDFQPVLHRHYSVK